MNGQNSVSTRSDIFSLGAIAYEMLAGTPAFPATTVPEVLFKIVYEHPEPLQKLQPSIPTNVATAIHRAMEKKPEDRYSSMQEFIEDIVGQSCFADTCEELPALAQSPAQITPDKKRWRPWLLLGVPALVFLVVLGLMSLPEKRAQTPDQNGLVCKNNQTLTITRRHLHTPHDTILAMNNCKLTIINADIDSDQSGIVARDNAQVLLQKSYISAKKSSIRASDNAVVRINDSYLKGAVQTTGKTVLHTFRSHFAASILLQGDSIIFPSQSVFGKDIDKQDNAKLEDRGDNIW